MKPDVHSTSAEHAHGCVSHAAAHKGHAEVPADRRARAAVRLQPRLPGMREDPVPDRDLAQAPLAPGRLRRGRGVRRADGLRRRWRAAAPPADQRDRRRPDRPQALRLPLHERGADATEDGSLQAVVVLLLGRPPRRAKGPPRRGRRSRGCLRRGRRGDPRGQAPRFSGHDQLDVLQQRLAEDRSERARLLERRPEGRRDDDLARRTPTRRPPTRITSSASPSRGRCSRRPSPTAIASAGA